MKLIIDIPDQEYEDIQAYNINMDGVDVVCESILHGTPIPDNATNGDVIKAIFPYIDEKSKLFKDNGTQYDISVDIGTKWASLDFDKEWWNASYKAESENRK